ncbi:MAG: methyltransferase domain-containing protein [Sphingobacteriaceae bacterium]|nr:methyltransferase domain-containing protein [Sphingobacteriaceae bacterium]
MPDKHYDSAYLEDTGRALKNIKEQSYTAFKQIEQGVIIDLGCGTGLDAHRLTEITPESVKVVGIDHDADMLNKAKLDAADTERLEFILSEACPLDFDNNSISGLRSERMIQHLAEPEKVVEEIYRVLHENAPLVIVETDWRSLSFYTGHPSIEKKVNDYLTEVKVKNGTAARNLTTYLNRIKFSNITLEVCPVVLRSIKEANDYLWFEKILNEAAHLGYVTEQERDKFYDNLKLADHLKYFVCAINLVIVTCNK